MDIAYIHSHQYTESSTTLCLFSLNYSSLLVMVIATGHSTLTLIAWRLPSFETEMEKDILLFVC